MWPSRVAPLTCHQFGPEGNRRLALLDCDTWQHKQLAQKVDLVQLILRLQIVVLFLVPNQNNPSLWWCRSPNKEINPHVGLKGFLCDPPEQYPLFGGKGFLFRMAKLYHLRSSVVQETLFK